LLEAGLGPVRRDRIGVELTDWVEPLSTSRKAWLRFATGTYFPITESGRPFEVEPGYALCANVSPNEVAIYLNTFSLEPDAIVAMDVARDAVLEGRMAEATRIARAALPYAHPLFLALVTKERNLIGQRGAVLTGLRILLTEWLVPQSTRDLGTRACTALFTSNPSSRAIRSPGLRSELHAYPARGRALVVYANY